MNPADPSAAPHLGLMPEQFAEVFPFHLAVDRNLTLVQTGQSLRRVCPDAVPGAGLDQVFRVVRPEGEVSYKWLADNQRELFLLAHLASGVQLRGQFMLLPGEQTLLFLGSPWFTESTEIAERGLGFEDFAIHDPVVDLLQLFQAQKMALGDAKKLLAKLTAQRTELRAANERLHRQEAETHKLALIAARTDNAVVLTDAEGKTEWVNEGFTRLTSYTLEEMLGKKPGAVLRGPGTDPETVRRISERLRQGKGFSEEILNYAKDGRSYWLAVEAQPIHDEQGRVTNFMAIELDITARRAAQQRLAIQFDVSRALLEAEFQAEGIRSVIETICVNLGWQIGQAWRLTEGRLRFFEVWHPPAVHVPLFVNASRAFEFAEGVGLPGRIWADARPAWLSDVTTDANFPRSAVALREGLRGAFGFPVFVHGVFWGVMEFFSRKIEQPDEMLLKAFTVVGNQIGQFIARQKAEAALRLAKETADTANKAKTEFLATISHELRTPLTSIRGFLQTLLSNLDMQPSTRQEFLGVVHDQSLRLSRLVDDLLDLSSLESGRTKFNDESVDVRQIAQTCLTEIGPLARSKSQRIEAALSGDLPNFCGDAIRLHSVFINLMSNAVKFTPAGGTIRVALHFRDDALQIVVEDTGPGIPIDQQSMIFEKFHRVYRREVPAAGTGLGLPIVKAIVEHYRGSIKVDSQVNRGSRFFVSLPLIPAQNLAACE
jgi:two-component system, sensor histidine kinase and response regulator